MDNAIKRDRARIREAFAEIVAEELRAFDPFDSVEIVGMLDAAMAATPIRQIVETEAVLAADRDPERPDAD